MYKVEISFQGEVKVTLESQTSDADTIVSMVQLQSNSIHFALQKGWSIVETHEDGKKYKW